VAVLGPIAMGSLAGNVATSARSRRASRTAALGRRRARPWAGAPALSRAVGLRCGAGMTGHIGRNPCCCNPPARNRVPGLASAVGPYSRPIRGAANRHRAWTSAGVPAARATSPTGLQQDVPLAAQRKLDDAFPQVGERELGGLIGDHPVVDAQAAAGNLPPRLTV